MRRHERHNLIVCVLVGASLVGASLARAHPLPGAPQCPVFPSNNSWNERVDRLPVARNSATLIGAIGLNVPLHAGFGAGLWDGSPIGIPYSVVSNTPSVHVRLDPAYASRAYRGLYPLVAGLPIEESDTDYHLIVVDRKTCLDYELFGAHPLPDGAWRATTGVVFNLRSNRLRPKGWTSADAAGLPILPGLARYDELAGGSIDHALRFTAPYTRAAFVYPARHYGSGTNNPSLPPMGLRVRLKAGVDISHLPRQARVIAIALKRYGMILADNGPAWYVSGAPNPRWNNDALRALGRLSGRDFEVVDTGSLPHPGQ